MAIILDGKAMFLKVMGANPPSSVEQTRCYNGGSLSFLTNYRCSAGSTQLVNNDSLFPKRTFLYSATSPEDAYQHGGQVAVIWSNTAWEPTGSSPMSIVASSTRFYNDNGWPSLISASSGYYMETSGSTRTYYTISNGIVTSIGTYTPGSSELCSANLQYMWMRDNSLDLSGLIAFKSQAHKGESPSYDVTKVTISGYSTFRCYIRSYAESNYDYTIASVLNASSEPLDADDATAYVSTKGNQQSGSALSNYTEVVFSGLTPSQTYFFYVVYRKDNSVDSGNDEGYLLLPSSATYSKPYTPSAHTYVFSRYTSSPVSVGSAAGTVTIRVNSTKDGSNLYLNSGSISVPSGITIQSVSTSGNVTVTLAYPKNTGAARSFPITITQPESGNVLEYSISQDAGQVVPGTYYFEAYTDELEIGTGSTSVQMSLTSCKRPSGGSLTPVGFTVSSLTSGLQLVDYDYDWQSSSAALVTLYFNAGTQSGTIRFVQNESGEILDIYVRRS